MINTRGERRFRIVELHDDAPYRSATVEYPVDEISEVPESLLERATEGYRQISKLRAITGGLFQRAPAIPKAPGMLADLIACAAGGLVDTIQLQKVLESFDNRERLEAAVDLLDSYRYDYAPSILTQHSSFSSDETAIACLRRTI